MNTFAVEIPPASEPGFLLATMNVQEGQFVQQGQPLAQLEKLDPQNGGHCEDLNCPQDGYVVGLRAIVGQIAHSGQVLCYICSQPTVPASQTGPQILSSQPAGFDPMAMIIFGGGGHGKTVIDLVRAMGTYHLVGVFDDGLPLGSSVLGIPVLGGSKDLAEWYQKGARLAVNAVGGIGNVGVRLKIFDILSNAGFTFPTIIHPSAVVERSATLDAGVQVLPHVYVGSDARVGFGTLLNAGAIVSHDCVLGQVVNLSPGATLAGNVHVRDHAQIGMRATVNVQVTVGAGARLGNGCTVKADVPDGGRVWAGTIWPIRDQSASK